MFDLPSFSLTEEMFTSHNNYPAQFDRHCEEILNCFSKKWHPASKRLEYMDTFSISNWKELPDSAKRKHSAAAEVAMTHIPHCNMLFQVNKCTYRSLPESLVSLPQQQKET